MPIIEVHLLEGRTRSQKAALVKALTEATSTTLHADPVTVRIILSEMKREHYAVGGTLFDESGPDQRDGSGPDPSGKPDG